MKPKYDFKIYTEEIVQTEIKLGWNVCDQIIYKYLTQNLLNILFWS